MSRSNPQDHVVNPSVRRFEWDSQQGGVRYFDKERKANVPVELPFSFLLLDQLSTVGGYHEPTNSGIFANEVKNIGGATLTVKAGGKGKQVTLAEGVYKDIKGDLAKLGGKFVAACYVAFADDAGQLVIGTIRFRGAALSAWLEFGKAKGRKALYESGIVITGSVDGKKGSVRYKSPTFDLVSATPEHNAQATALDAELQAYLSVALKRQAQPTSEPSDSDERGADIDESFDPSELEQ